MEEICLIAESEMLALRHPYVGTEHFFLAYLKKYDNEYINYEEFKKYMVEIIGSSYKESEYILYTPLLRKIVNESKNEKEAILKILSDDDAIAYNILLSKNYDIETIYLNILNSMY
mgnify:FL=1